MRGKENMSETNMQDCESLTREFSKGALAWYRFNKNSRILYVYT